MLVRKARCQGMNSFPGLFLTSEACFLIKELFHAFQKTEYKTSKICAENKTHNEWVKPVI